MAFSQVVAIAPDLPAVLAGLVIGDETRSINGSMSPATILTPSKGCLEASAELSTQ